MSVRRAIAERALTPGLRSRIARRGRVPRKGAGGRRQGWREHARPASDTQLVVDSRVGATLSLDVAGPALILSGTARGRPGGRLGSARRLRVRDRLRVRRGSVSQPGMTRGRGNTPPSSIPETRQHCPPSTFLQAWPAESSCRRSFGSDSIQGAGRRGWSVAAGASHAGSPPLARPLRGSARGSSGGCRGRGRQDHREESTG